MRIEFVVYGTPQPAGSKKAVPMGRGPNVRWGVVDDNAKSRPWKKLIMESAVVAMERRALMHGPVMLSLRFFKSRPKGHFNAKGELRASAPKHPTTKPDLTKLVRGAEDGLKGIVWRDDSQVVGHLDGSPLKAYTLEQERVEIIIEELPEL